MSSPKKFRCWLAEYQQYACQGEPDLETLYSFIFHYGDKELEQCTGLKDKNGNLIWENDIVLFDGLIVVVVEFYAGAFGYWLRKNKPHREFISFAGNPNFTFNSVMQMSSRHEIIGNVHENKDFTL